MPRPTGRPLALALPLLAVCGLAVVLAVGLACDFGDDSGGPAASPSPEPTATAAGVVTPEDALERYVRNRWQQSFVANCDDASRPGDVGKRCARLRGERNGMLAFELGPTFSEYTQLIILSPAGDDWTLLRLEGRDTDEEPVPGIPWPLEVGATVIVAGTGDCLRVRDRPGTLAPEITCLDDGNIVTIAEGPVDVDDREWWRLEGYGWGASNWLRYPEDVPEQPEVTPEE